MKKTRLCMCVLMRCLWWKQKKKGIFTETEWCRARAWDGGVQSKSVVMIGSENDWELQWWEGSGSVKRVGAQMRKLQREGKCSKILFSFFVLFFYFDLLRFFNRNRRKFYYTEHSRVVFNNRLRICVVNCNFLGNNYKIATAPLSRAVAL